MKKKLFLLMTISAVSAATLAGCGNTSETTASTESSTVEAQTTEASVVASRW